MSMTKYSKEAWGDREANARAYGSQSEREAKGSEAVLLYPVQPALGSVFFSVREGRGTRDK